MAELHLKGKTYSFTRLKLRKWLEFEKSQENINKAIEDKNVEEYARHLYILISSVLNIEIEEMLDVVWYETIEVYSIITNLNKVKEIPLLKSDPSKPTKIPWEYDGRSWFWWVNLFAKNYGWTSIQVEDLDIDDAVSLLQEILVDEQMDREWDWDLSELAYPYNETTKKHVYKPLPRPAWMEERKVFLPATKIRFKKSFLPVGKIVGENGEIY